MSAWSVSEFTRCSKSKAGALSVLAALLVASADYLTGAEISFSLFYLLPVSFATWRAGRGAGLALSSFCAALWLINDFILSGRTYSHPAIAFWNALMRMFIFLLVSWLLSRLRETLFKEQETGRLKSDMLSLVSHEINNTLTAMDLAFSLIKETSSEKETADGKRKIYFNAMDRGITVLKGTVENFLNQSRMESGRFALSVRPTELRVLVDECLASVRLIASSNDISISRDFPSEVIPLSADPDALALAITNLIGNAIKYTPRGGRVGVRLARDGPGRVRISVEDTGIGISLADRERILAGFFRTEEGKRTAKGYGIGLKVTREILEGHGTRLEIESEPLRGSRFHFTLPVSDQRPALSSP